MERRYETDYLAPNYFLFGELNVFMNRLQTTGDQFLPEISWKQWYVLEGISLFASPPTVGEIADAIGSSHQNVKQVLLKLESAGFVELFTDEMDKRKLRARETGKVSALNSKYQRSSFAFMESLYQGISEEDIAVTKKTISVMDRNLVEIRHQQVAD